MADSAPCIHRASHTPAGTRPPARTARGYLLLPVSIALVVAALATYMIAREQSVMRATGGGGLSDMQYSLSAELGIARQRMEMSMDGLCGTYQARVTMGSTFGLPYNVVSLNGSNSGTDVKIRVDLKDVATGDILRDYELKKERAYQGINELILQPDAVAGKDGFISSVTATYNYGGMDLGYIGNFENQLFEFDLGALPSNVRVLSAALKIYVASLDTPGSVSVHRIKAPWDEGTRSGFNGGGPDGATWLNRTTLLPWLTPGGEHQVPPEAVEPVETAGRWYSFELTRLVRQWTAGTHPNYGVLLKARDGLHGARPWLSDAVPADAAFRPKLHVIYGCECGKTCGSLLSCDGTVVPVGQDVFYDWTSFAAPTSDFKGLSFLRENEMLNGGAAPKEGGILLLDRPTRQLFLIKASNGSLVSSLTITMTGPMGVAYVRGGAWADHFAVVDENDRRVYYLDAAGAVQGSALMSAYLAKPFSIDHISTTGSGVYSDHLAVLADDAITMVLGVPVATALPGIRIIDQAGVLKKTIDTGAYAAKPRGIAHIPGRDEFWVFSSTGISVHRVDFDGNLLATYDAGTLGVGSATTFALNLETCTHMFPDSSQRNIEIYGQTAPGGGGGKGK